MCRLRERRTRRPSRQNALLTSKVRTAHTTRPSQRYADAEYQAYQDGPWVQAPVGDLNGTTR